MKVENLSLGPQGTCPLAPVTRLAVPLTLSEQKRLVFEVTDGVKTPEEVTPWEGELMSPATRSSLSFNLAALDFYLGLYWV